MTPTALLALHPLQVGIHTFLNVDNIGELLPLVWGSIVAGVILGLIAGLKLFGFWGFIFGPLLISYLLLLVRIYRSEFGGQVKSPNPPST